MPPVVGEKGGERRYLLYRDELLGGLRRQQHVPRHLLLGDAARLRRVGDLLLD